MPLVRWSSRSVRIVTRVLGPLGAMVGLIWAMPLMGSLFGSADSPHGASGERVFLSSLLDESRRRDRLPVLSRLRTFDAPDDFQGILLFADALDDRLMMVGSTMLVPVDLRNGTVEPAIDLGGFTDTVGRVLTATKASPSELWIAGTDGIALLDPAAPDRPARVVTLDDEAVRPIWFGDVIVAAGRTTLLRFYATGAADDTIATLVREAGEPLFPIVDSGLLVFFNLVSFTVHPDQKQFAVAFQLADRLHIYNHDGAVTRAITGPVEVKLDFDIVPRSSAVGGHTFGINGETRMAYLDVDSDGDVIASLFAGRSRNAGAANIFSADELHVFRWDGTLVGVWRLPEAVISFRLDEVRRRIYAVCRNPSWSVIELDASPIYSGDDL